MRALFRSWGLLLLITASAAWAQTGVRVELDDVTDNRVEAGEFRGGLEMRVKLEGTNLDKATAARIVVKEAKDDRGNDLGKGAGSSDFTPRDYNSGTLQVAVGSPARAARTVKIKGNVELFVPTRDPNALVKVDNALANLDKPLSAKALKAAKIAITPLSPAAYAKVLEERKIDDKKIASIREEGKKRGVPEKEIELMIGLAQALQSMNEPPGEGTVILSGRQEDFDRVFRIDILGADGEPIDIPSRSTSSMGDDSIMTLQPSQPPPANAALRLHLLTAKSKVSSPFELTVELP